MTNLGPVSKKDFVTKRYVDGYALSDYFATPHFVIEVAYPFIHLHKGPVQKMICDSENEFEKTFILLIGGFNLSSPDIYRFATVNHFYMIMEYLRDRSVVFEKST